VDIAFGRVAQCLSVGGLDPLEVAVRVGLRLTETGVAGDWEARCPGATLRLGSLLLDGAARLRVEGRAVPVWGEAGACVTCARGVASDDWLTTAELVPRIPSTGSRRAIHLLGASALPPADGGAGGFDGVRPVASIDPPTLATYRRAFALLRAAAPQYVAWVER